MLEIKKATCQDLDKIMEIYRIAQDYMIQSGNPNQWAKNHPQKELIAEDISKERCLIICEENEIHGVFALFSEDDPTYHVIENGSWLNNEPYLTIHRIASDRKVRGLFKCACDYCKSISDNIRIDTHKDNLTMQHVIEKNGFKKCGIIYIADGSPRLAFQWTK